ncbi:MAG: hypothetical protein M3440_06765, partial [Chloroflexota bacterium]|nr:hypothetical protein [Chloroflexota bacterium]
MNADTSLCLLLATCPGSCDTFGNTSPMALIADDRVTARELKPLVDARLPIVVVNNAVEPDGFDVVRTTRDAAFDRAVHYLAECGHRRMAFIGPLSGNATHLRRFQASLADNDIAVDPR